MACYVKDYFAHHTIRSASCSILVQNSEERCSSCSHHRLVLHSMLHRNLKSTDGASPTSHTNYRFLSYQMYALITLEGAAGF